MNALIAHAIRTTDNFTSMKALENDNKSCLFLQGAIGHCTDERCFFSLHRNWKTTSPVALAQPEW